MLNCDAAYELVNDPFSNTNGEFTVYNLKKSNNLASYITYLEDNSNNIISLNQNIYEEKNLICCNTDLIKKSNLLEFITYINNKNYASFNGSNLVSKKYSISSGDIIMFKTSSKDTFLGLTVILDSSLFKNNNNNFHWMTSNNLLIPDAQFLVNTFKI